MSSEPISDAMIKACLDNEQDFIETVLAYDAVALVATPDAGLTCLPGETVYDAWQLGAEEELTWADLGSELLESRVSFYGPDDLSPAYLLFKNLVPAGALREDIVFADDAQAILDKVQEEGASAFGFMSLADFERLSAETELVPLAIETEDGECVSPTLASLANRTYPLARTEFRWRLKRKMANASRQRWRAWRIARTRWRGRITCMSMLPALSGLRCAILWRLCWLMTAP